MSACTHSPAFPISGGQYLTVSAAKGPGGKAARLGLPLGHLMHSGDLCLSFRHKVTGLHSGTLQVFVRKHGAHGAALWGRNGGHGWRRTQITLRGADIKSVSRTAKEAEPGKFSFHRRTLGTELEDVLFSSLIQAQRCVCFLGMTTPFIASFCNLFLLPHSSVIASCDCHHPPLPYGKAPIFKEKKFLGIELKVNRNFKGQGW